MVVIGFFFSALIAARTQQSILSSLAAVSSDRALGYSEALAQLQALKATDAAREQRGRALQQTEGQLAALQLDLDGRRQRTTELQNDVAAMAANLRAGGGCDLPDLERIPLLDLDSLLARMDRCLRGRRPVPEEAATVATWRREAAPLIAAHLQQEQVAATLFTRAERLRAEAARGDVEPANAAELRRAFQDYEFIRSIPALDWLVMAPPFVTQIFLVSVSGVFGALLILLIVIVYPDNDVKLSTGRGFTRRLVLGGLVAIAMYVLLTSGVAVVQGDAAIATDANVMAFALAGLLAGAFADRVARWLSTRADLIFADRVANSTGQDDRQASRTA